MFRWVFAHIANQTRRQLQMKLSRWCADRTICCCPGSLLHSPVNPRGSFRSSLFESLELMTHRPSELVALIAVAAFFCHNVNVIVIVAITVGEGCNPHCAATPSLQRSQPRRGQPAHHSGTDWPCQHCQEVSVEAIFWVLVQLHVHVQDRGC